MGAIHRVALAAILALLSVGVHAAESLPVKTSHVTASLITDTDAVQPGHVFGAALRLVMAPGWHTYWKNPGDAGAPPELAVHAPAGTAVGPMTWPAPERLAEGDLTTFAYRGELVLPVQVTPRQAPLSLTAHASWLVCRDICVPEEGDFVLPLPGGAPAASVEAPLFAAAAARSPRPAPFQTMLAGDGRLIFSGPGLPANVVTAEFFPSEDGVTDTAGAQRPADDAGRLSIQVALGARKSAEPLDGVVRLTQSDGTTEAFAVVAKAGSPPALSQPVALPALLAFALAGGLLLNLMPCVFPVLAMKAVALARLTAADRRTVRIEAWSYTAGVMATFVALGAALRVFRSAGETVGWGFQFQSPLFVTAIAWLLFATGLNMSGVFSVGERLAGAGQSLASKPGHVGSFFTGLLAVIVATPCTVSFMGAALAGAAAVPAALSLLVFAAMGMGLALPYAVIAVLPGVARVLPRPGRWMTTLRQALAFPMYGAAVWLAWVVSQQTGPAGVLTLGVGLVGVAIGAWAFGVAQVSHGRGRYWGHGVTMASGLAVLTLLPFGATPSSETSEPYSPARLAELRGEGRPVFVNMTAAWCLSCLVNERIALSPAAVRGAFARAHVAYLKGDWTRQDPAVSTFLRDHEREGVPLYVFYAPGQAPVILPQLLSQQTLLDQVAKLGG